jgi:hypothetical protein
MSQLGWWHSQLIKNKIYVPNHQSVRGSDKVFATFTNIFSVSNAGPWWYEFRADTGLCWGKRLLQWHMEVSQNWSAHRHHWYPRSENDQTLGR